VEPPGFRYFPDFLSSEEQTRFTEALRTLPYKPVRMHGVTAKRTVAHFGWDYDYEAWKIRPAEPPPALLCELRDRCAETIGLRGEDFEEILATRYPPGAGIGWHRDAPMFGRPVIGVSLLSPCVMRFRRPGESSLLKRELAPGSMYVLDGEARRAWQHSVPPVRSLRFSVTFRTVLRDGKNLSRRTAGTSGKSKTSTRHHERKAPGGSTVPAPPADDSKPSGLPPTEGVRRALPGQGAVWVRTGGPRAD
jgi:DNA oxidative demethylase